MTGRCVNRADDPVRTLSELVGERIADRSAIALPGADGLLTQIGHSMMSPAPLAFGCAWRGGSVTGKPGASLATKARPRNGVRRSRTSLTRSLRFLRLRSSCAFHK